MLKLNKFVTSTLSFRLLLRVLLALATLLIVALLIMFYYSRRVLKEEALHTGSQTLETTVQEIDNILLSVEQATGNVYWKVLNNMNHPERLEVYRRKIVEATPYISDCMINLSPADDAWYSDIVKTGIGRWTDPREMDGKKGERGISFCLPIFKDNKTVGVMSVDMPLTLLSEIVMKTKPSPNSYCTLLGRDGSYIVHPDTNKLNHLTILTQQGSEASSSAKEAAKAMVAGETGYKHVSLQGKDYYVFFKPFIRSEAPERIKGVRGWSIGIIYPENDIFGEYNSLLYLVLAIVAAGLLLLFLLCRDLVHRQLKPLQILTTSAQHIADGHYDDPIPDTRQEDEVGRLQKHFQEMQQSLSIRMGEMAQLTTTLQERGAVLQDTYERAKEADRMKTNFLYSVTNQMTSRVKSIYSSVKAICSDYNKLTEHDTHQLTEQIEQGGEYITTLLNELIANSEKKKN